MNFKVRFWFALCLFFSFYNLKLLIDDYDLINYVIVEPDDELYDNKTIYMICTSFKEIKSKDKLKLKEKQVSIDFFLNYSRSSIEDVIGFKNLFILNRSLIINGKVCFEFDENAMKKESFRKFLKTYETYLYVSSDGNRNFNHEYIYKKVDYYFDFILFKIIKQKVYGKNYLESDCFLYKDQLDKNRFKCLDSCSKMIQKTIFNYYEFNESGLIDLKLISGLIKNNDSKKTNEIIKEMEDENLMRDLDKKYGVCFEKCPEKNCFLETYNVLVDKSKDELKDRNKKSFKILTNIYKAYYSTTYFYLQFIGLLTLLTGTSLIVTLPSIILLIATKFNLKYNRYFEKFFPKFKFTLSVFGFTLLLQQSIFMYMDYRNQSDYPFKTKILNYSSEMDPFSLILCFPIENLIYDDFRIEKNRNSEILTNYTIGEIINKSSCDLKKKIEKIDLSYGSRNEKFEWTVSEEIMFKNDTINDKKLFTRCFRIEIEIRKMKFRSLIPFFTLRIWFKNIYWRFHLIDQGERLTSNLVNLAGHYYIAKFIKKSFGSKKSNCTDYFKKKTCKSRQNCQDHCINKRFFRRYSSFATQSVINMNEIKSYLDFFNESSKFNESIDEHIEMTCMEKFKKDDCNRSIYEDTISTAYYYDSKRIFINLYFEKHVQNEIEPSFPKLILNLLNLESILFGSNATTLLLTFFHFLKKVFNLKWHKAYRLIIFVICMFGFTGHNYYIFNVIINNELIDNGYFEKLEVLNLPNLIFCFNFTESNKDINHKLTGNYLDELTKNVTYESVFSKINYTNKTHWKIFRPTQLNSSRDEEISISYFYFLQFKCFEIDLMTSLSENSLFLTKSKIFLRVFFRETIRETIKYVFFTYRERGSKEFNSFYPFQIGKFDEFHHKYQIAFESFKIKKDDKFETLKNLKNLFQIKRTSVNDVSKYLNEMKMNFETQFNLTTKEILLEQKRTEDFNYEIDDEMFEQFYRQVQNVSDQTPSSLNYEKSLYNVYSQIISTKKPEELKSGDFMYYISPVIRKTEFTNDDNYAKLIQSLLNALSLWLNIGILDIYIYLYKLPNLIKVFYKLLIKFKFYLESLHV